MPEHSNQVENSAASRSLPAETKTDPAASGSSCEKCGAPALVHISNGSGQVSLMRHLCLDCAAAEDALVPRERTLNLAALLIVVGLFTLAISAAADALHLGATANFGVRQLASTALALILVIAGAIIRIPTVAVVGIMMGSITLLADWLALGGRAGFGFKQTIGCMLGCVLIAVGLALSRRRS